MATSFNTLLMILLALMGASIVIALVGLLMLIQRIRRLRIPRNADFFTTMRAVPISLVILLDLLDFGLDIFSAPISWIVLDRMGLYSLRNKAAIEALIPFTQPIPTFTLSWFAARALNLGAPNQAADGRWNLRDDQRRRNPPTIIDMDEP